jgi:hypothetical protein
MSKKKWHGTIPSKCDLCKGKFTDGVFIDGKTVYGPWALMCSRCHWLFGQGLGLGYGQKYDLKTLEKLKG